MQKTAVDLINKEEQEILVNEMRQCLSFFKSMHLSLMQSLLIKQEEAPWKKCMRHLIIHKILLIERQFERAAASFKEDVGEVPGLYSAFHRGEPNQAYFTDCDFDGDDEDDEDDEVDEDEEDDEVDEDGED